jgi:undecaprenyl-diphosphatase
VPADRRARILRLLAVVVLAALAVSAAPSAATVAAPDGGTGPAMGAPGRPTADGGAGSADDTALDEAGRQLTPAKALVLGVVEGVTEFLPISSTGHLLVAERIMGIGQTPGTKEVADSYAIAIQAGAILAIVLLYLGRLRSMVAGILGRDPSGRRVAVGLVVAFVPAAVIGVAFEPLIKERLLGTWQVIVAWIVWGVVILVVADRWAGHTGGVDLDAITVRQGLLIGIAQCLSMWPGTSRSLVTILAALAVGLSLGAAVEFSFLLGLVTLGAATGYEALTNGATMVDAYGWVAPLLGLAAAFVSAAVAVRWMVGYLQRHSLAIFGWYRIALGVGAAALVLTGTI